MKTNPETDPVTGIVMCAWEGGWDVEAELSTLLVLLVSKVWTVFPIYQNVLSGGKYMLSSCMSSKELIIFHSISNIWQLRGNLE